MFFFFILFDPTSPIFNRDFKGFREDYFAKVITFDRSLPRRGLILPIFFFLSKLMLKERKKLFEFIFEKVQSILSWFDDWRELKEELKSSKLSLEDNS